MASSRRGAGRRAAGRKPSTGRKPAARRLSTKGSGGGGGAGPKPKSRPESKPKPTFERVWATLDEVAKAQREGEKARLKGEKELRELREVLKASEEARLKGEEARLKGEKAVKESQLKTEKSLRELRKSLDEADGNFNRKWGRFLENLLEGDLAKMLKKRGIEVERVTPRLVSNRIEGLPDTEYDLVAVNGREMVVVEVKTTLAAKDVRRFLRRLGEFKRRFPEYAGRTVHGGVACMSTRKAPKGPDPSELVQEAGLFFIKSPGGARDVSEIANKKGFKPAEF